MKSLKQLLVNKQIDKNKYISREWQDYAYELAVQLGDMKHKSLYMRLAKTVPRAILEQAKRFVVDSNADNKGALFMWKLKELNKAGKKM